MVRHLSKKGRHAIYRGGGSIGILGACRSAWLTGRDPTDPSRFILAQTKNNLGAQLPALAYTISDNRQQTTDNYLPEGQGEGSSSLPLPPGEGRGEGAALAPHGPSFWARVFEKQGQSDGAFTPHAPRATLHDCLLSWLGPCEIHPNDILAPSPPPRPRARTRQILEDLLADGPLPYAEIVRQAPRTSATPLSFAPRMS
jgi:hypothetical protein